MRTAARTDANQGELVEALHAIGCSVQHMHQLGKGCPDLLVGYRGVNFVIEAKDGRKPPSKRKLTAAEKAWHLEWRGQVAVVNSVEEAIALVTGGNE